jgi:hypothetical protein
MSIQRHRALAAQNAGNHAVTAVLRPAAASMCAVFIAHPTMVKVANLVEPGLPRPPRLSGRPQLRRRLAGPYH